MTRHKLAIEKENKQDILFSLVEVLFSFVRILTLFASECI